MTSPSPIIVQQFEIGPLNNFIYFLGDAKTKKIAVIDPAWDVPFLRKQAQKQGFEITLILLTHGHPDHVNGLNEILSSFPVPVYISQKEAAMFKPKCQGLKEIAPNEKIKIGNIEIECLHTPGHSPGCQCFLVGNQMISGDTLFVDGCGRCDLPGSDPRQMYDSLYNKIMKLPDSLIFYPGHNYGPTKHDTIANQKRTNPYLQCASLEEFLGERMGISL